MWHRKYVILFAVTYYAIYLVICNFIQPFTWFRYADTLHVAGAWLNLVVLIVPAILAVGLLALRESKRAGDGLTPSLPRDKWINKMVWRNSTRSNEIIKALSEKESSVVLRMPGLPFDRVRLTFSDKPDLRYDRQIKPILQRSLEIWKVQNSTRAQELDNEEWGLQVRLEKAEYSHKHGYYQLELSPTKYLYYLSIQARLWHKDLRKVRDYSFVNALRFATTHERPILPNQFAIHMAIVSADKKVMIRKRSDETMLFTGSWESSIGEFMHGPKQTECPHFIGDSQPDFLLFLKNSLKEEINYDVCSPSEFYFYGLAVEYRTLAPKLLVIWLSRDNMSTLMEKWREARDPAIEVSSLALNPKDLHDAFLLKDRPSWTPSSKIVTLYAATHGMSKEQKAAFLEEFQGD